MNLPTILGSFRRKTFAAAAVRPARRRPRLDVMTLETRVVPSTIPAPVIDSTSIRTLNTLDSGNGYSPAMAVDPTNPNRLVSVFIRTEANSENTNRIVFKFSNNGGSSWFTSFPANLGISTTTNLTTPLGVDPKAPTVLADAVILPYVRAGTPQIAFDRFSNVYVVYAEYNADDTSGRIILRRFNFTGTTLVETAFTPQDALNSRGGEQTIYKWVDGDKAYNPTVAIDTNLATSVDPDGSLTLAQRTQTDPLAGLQTDVNSTRVFVAWNTDNIPPLPGTINPNVIRMAVSDDGGLNFGPNVVANDDGNFPTGDLYSQPKIVFTQGRAGQAGSGGNMALVFSDNVASFPTLKSDSRVFTAANAPKSAQLSSALSMNITDATDPGNGAPHDPKQTIYPLNVGSLTGITHIDSISLSVDIRHDDLKHVRIELLPPNVATPPATSAGTAAGYQLVLNRVDAAGNDSTVGIQGTELGIHQSAFLLNTIFQDSASRSIIAGNAGTPYSGEYQPQYANQLINMNLFFGGLSAANIISAANGGWRVRITDFRKSLSDTTNPLPAILAASLRITQNMTDDSDPNNTTALRGFDNPTGALTDLNNFTGRQYATLPSGNPTNGVGAGLHLATDNSLGAFSPFENRIFAAFNRAGVVRVRYSDDGGQTWSATTNVGAGFTPQIAVDATTGTVMIAYYSTQFDAAGVRSAMMFSTSIDGSQFTDPSGISFSTPTAVNPVEQYYDQIVTKAKTFEPITSNGLQVGPDGYGDNLALYAFNGRVNLVHAGNWNEPGITLRTQNMNIAAGPRILTGDQGPILADATVTELVQNGTGFGPGNVIPFNNTFDTFDGHRKFTGFVVTLDRAVDPSTFTAADIIVKYRDPDDDASTGGTDIPTADISVQRLDFYKDPINGTDYGSRRFLVHVNTQSIDTIAPYRGVGTYSYAVKGDIADRVRGLNFQITSQPAVPFTFSGPPKTIFDAVPPLTTPTNAPIIVSGIPAAQAIGHLTVKVRITHPDLSQLRLELVNPAGFSIPLVLEGDVFYDPNLLQSDYGTLSGANTNFTSFDDGAVDTIATTLDVAPYLATYRPVGPLAQFNGGNPNGTWFLRVTDTVQNAIGTIDRAQLIITPSTTTVQPAAGNKVDENGDGVENQAQAFPGVQNDWFATPKPISGAPFSQSYVHGTLPVVVTGPRLIASEPLGGTGTTDNIALNQNISALDVQFDRTMDASTFSTADVLRITGPLGDITLTTGVTVTPINGFGGATLAAGTNSKFFRIGFLQQKVSGSYTVQLSSDIADINGLKLDTSADAGVDNLTGEAINSTLTLEQKKYGGGVINVPIAANSTTTVTLNVPDSYSVQRVLATLTVTHLHVRNLEGVLVSPDGSTSVLLFKNSPTLGSDDAQTIPFGQTDPDLFTNITFSDTLPGTPIQNGGTTNGTYNPIQPLAQLIGTPSFGAWKLVIRNLGSLPGTVKMFQLQFDKQAITSGLGEKIADQISVGFHIFQSNGGDATTRNNWTPIGPNGQSSVGTVGRISAIAVDPGDPSGNTVYASGASGGVWRTANFLTRDPLGPNWIPLTDFGPNGSINVGSLAIFPDPNGDPLKTTVLVGTGSDALSQTTYDRPGSVQYNFDGVGFLVSPDSGKTWKVLDSLSNTFTAAKDDYRPIGDAGRDHRFVGAWVNKVVFEPSRNKDNNLPIAYAAVSRGAAAAGVEGIYRSLDGGRTWTQFALPDTGDVLDFVLGAGSAPVTQEQTLERTTIGYLTIKGKGVYRSVNLNSTFPSFTLMDLGPTGLAGVGRPTVNSGAVGTDAPPNDPMGAKGKIALASPAYQPGNPLANTYYSSWLYAAVSTANGDFDGLYVTKDAGSNWTKVQLMTAAAEPLFTHNTLVGPGGGNHSLSVAVDPLNPNIVYLGSDQIVRVDTTFLNDPYNMSLYQYSNADGGAIRPLTTGGAQVDDVTLDDGVFPDAESGLNAFDVTRSSHKLPDDSLTPLTFAGELEPEFRRVNRFKWNFLNLEGDPYRPFSADTTLTTTNVLKFLNTGADATSFVVAEGSRDWSSVSQIITTIDPLTGKARITYGTDNGLASFVRDDGGGANSVPGFTQPHIQVAGLGAQTSAQLPTTAAASAQLQINGSRNGDIQVARLYDGDVSPSLLAATISNAFAYGVGRRTNDVQGSTENNLSTGSAAWYNPVNRANPANSVHVDEQGDGVVFILRRIDQMNNVGAAYPALDQPTLPPNGEFYRSDFFQVQKNGGGTISRTGQIGSSLFLDENDANGSNSQWDDTDRVFAVSPFNRDPNPNTHKDSYGLVIGSTAGRIYRSQNSGLKWFEIGDPAIFNNSYATALTFGAPIPDNVNPRGDNDHIYVGTEEGRVWVTEFGGVAASNWHEVSAGLDNSRVLKILANPLSGSREAYAVTEHGVFHMADWKAAGATWVNLTNNLPNINHTAFGDATTGWTSGLLEDPATPGNTKATLTSMAVDWRPAYATPISKPVLYVGGDGGVFKSTDSGTGTVWVRYPASATDAAGGLASSPGGGMPIVKVTDLDLSIGNMDPQTGQVSSNGIANVLIATTLGRGSWSISLGQQGVTAGRGPKVQSYTPTYVTPGPNNPYPALDKLQVKFSTFIDPASFTLSDIRVTTPSGNVLPTSAYTLTNQAPATDNSLWTIDFIPDLTLDGTYTILVGPDITDGPTIAGGYANKMNQDGDGINGEDPADAFKFQFTVGTNDLIDYVKDSYQSLLGRLPVVSTAELGSTNVANMDKFRATALSTVVRDLLMTFNSNEARKGLVDRIFKTAGGANLELGNLLPVGYNLAPADRDAIVARLNSGATSPQKLIVEIMTGMTSTANATVIPGLGQTYYTNAVGALTGTAAARAYLTQVYKDLFRFTPAKSRIDFSWLPVATQDSQIAAVDTAAKRFTFVNSMINSLKAITFYEGGVVATANKKTIYVRDWITQLAYAKYLNRTIDPTTFSQSLSSAEKTNGRTLLATAPANGQLQGIERLYQKVLGSKEFLSLNIQVGGVDAGLHTNRAWVAGVFSQFVRRGGAATAAETDTQSQNILNLFETQRDTFIKGLLNLTEYKNLQADKYFQIVWGRNATTAEKTTWRNNLAAGKTYADNVAGQFGSTAFYNAAPTVVGGGSTASMNTWARAVLIRAFGGAFPANDPQVVALETRASTAGIGKTRATLELVMNSDAFRNKVIDDAFTAALGRTATTAEKDAYRAFLASTLSTGGKNHWEKILEDIMALGNVVVAGQTVSLPRDFWEVTK